MLKRGTKAALSFLLAALLLWLFFRRLDVSEILDHMDEARPGWIAVAVAMQGVHLVLRSLRWRVLLSPMKRGVRFYNLLSTTAIGYLLSFVLFRIGELVRPVMLGQREDISRTGAVATCVLERLMDFLTVALLLGVYLIFVFEPPPAPTGALDVATIRAAGLVFGLATLACFPILYVMVHRRQRLFDLLDRRMGQGALAPRLLHGFLGGFDVVKGGRLFTLAWAQSLAVWLSITAAIWASLRAFDLGVRFQDAFLMLGLLTFGIAIPTPGAVGSFEYLGQIGLVEFFGVAPNRAAAAILVTHAFSIGPVILLGLALLWRDGLSLRGVSRMGEAPAARPSSGSTR